MPGLSQIFVDVVYAILFAFVSAIVCTSIWVVILKRVAKRLGLVDHPDDRRKLHSNSMPVIGGIAVFAGTVITLVLSIAWFPDLWIEYAGDFRGLVGLGAASAFLLLVGVVDDRFGIRGRQKLAGQFVAGAILVMFGFTFGAVQIFGNEIQLGFLAIPLAIVWILGTINSVNLVDGADGIATTIGIIVGISLTLTAVWHERFVDALIATAFTASLIAFLYFNLPPASAFLGDAGSMLIGLVFGAIAIRCSFKETFAYSFAAPVAILAIPLFDSVVAITRRVLTGRSIYTTDRSHLHHTLLRHGLTPRKMLFVVAGLSSLTAICGTICVFTRQEWVAILGVGLVFATLISFRIFGFSEFMLVRNRGTSFLRSLVTFNRSVAASAPQSDSTRLQGTCDWDTYWQELTEFANSNGLTSVRLDIDLPWIHEGFHASWKQKSSAEPGKSWQSRLPLVAEEKNCGRIEVSGPADNLDYLNVLQEFTRKVHRFEEVVSAASGNVPQPEKRRYKPEPMVTEFAKG